MKRELRANLNVLIVEPNEYYRRTYVTILHGLGFKQVTAESNSADAMQSIRLGRTKLLIIGDQLQPQSGCAFVHGLRHLGDPKLSQIPVVMITDRPKIENVQQARDVGVNEILANPVSAKAMESRVLSAIGNPRAFVDVENYIGPDRRRRRPADYKGKERRRIGGDAASRDKSVS